MLPVYRIDSKERWGRGNQKSFSNEGYAGIESGRMNVFLPNGLGKGPVGRRTP